MRLRIAFRDYGLMRSGVRRREVHGTEPAANLPLFPNTKRSLDTVVDAFELSSPAGVELRVIRRRLEQSGRPSQLSLPFVD